jgi:NADPH-dependent glutamate synthase beta subunit-like oxidoreductase
VAGCPAEIDIPRYVAAVAAGNDQQALEVIRARVPFPGILGYACFHPCEDACRRGGIDQPVAICDLKRYVFDAESGERPESISKKPGTGKKIAIIGAGPGGCTSAYYLGALGHQVSLYDREAEPGGMLRYGIPDYRLPPDVLNREMEALQTLGVSFHMNYSFDRRHGLDELKSRGYDAVLLAVGAAVSKALTIEGADLEGVLSALEFLRAAKLSQLKHIDGNVAVIGGGNVAIDAAMTAVRLGARSVQMICLEAREEMPAHDWEIKQAEEEGVQVVDAWGPIRFTSSNGKVSGVELRKCVNVFDGQGRFDPQYDEDKRRHIDADSIVVAVGQETEEAFLSADGQLSAGPGNRLKVDNDLAAGPAGVFAAGDVIRGPSSIIDAIADGRRAADVIDKYLGGAGLEEAIDATVDTEYPAARISAETFDLPRHSDSIVDATERTSGFGPINSTLTETAARAEAQRCLRCFVRQKITSVTLPPAKWLPLNDESVASVPQAEGVYQLLNAEKKVLCITGAIDLRQSLSERLENPGEAEMFLWEEDPMFTKRESELIQQYLQKYGELPGGSGGGDDLDDLF